MVERECLEFADTGHYPLGSLSLGLPAVRGRPEVRELYGFAKPHGDPSGEAGPEASCGHQFETAMNPARDHRNINP